MATGRPTNLTDKQERFCQEYLIDCNAKQAAIRTGYSARTAEQQGSRLLSKAKVAQRIAQLQEKVSSKLDITKEKIIKEYAKLAFTNSEEIFDWKMQEIDVLKPDGTVEKEVVAKPFLKQYEEMEDNAKAAISEIRETNQGIAIKMHDKKSALDSLSKVLGFWSDKHELSTDKENPVKFEINFVKERKGE